MDFGLAELVEKMESVVGKTLMRFAIWCLFIIVVIMLIKVIFDTTIYTGGLMKSEDMLLKVVGWAGYVMGIAAIGLVLSAPMAKVLDNKWFAPHRKEADALMDNVEKMLAEGREEFEKAKIENMKLIETAEELVLRLESEKNQDDS